MRKPWSLEARERQSKRLLGHVVSEEVRKKIIVIISIYIVVGILLTVGSNITPQSTPLGDVLPPQAWTPTTTPFVGYTIYFQNASSAPIYIPYSQATTSALAITGILNCTQALETTSNGDVICGTDAEGAGGSGSNWQFTPAGDAITPTTTVGVILSASSTINSTLEIGGAFSASSTSSFSGLATFDGGFVSTASSSIGGVLTVDGHLSASSSASVTGPLTVDDLTSALVLAASDGQLGEYTGIDCTNQFVRDVSAAGAGTCNTVGTADVAGLDQSDDLNLTAGDNLTLTDDDIDLDANLVGMVTGAFSGGLTRQNETWNIGLSGALAPTTTVGIIVTASSTINGDFFVNSGATTTGLSYFQLGFIASASSTVLGDFTINTGGNLVLSSTTPNANLELSMNTGTTSLRGYDGSEEFILSPTFDKAILDLSSTTAGWGSGDEGYQNGATTTRQYCPSEAVTVVELRGQIRTGTNLTVEIANSFTSTSTALVMTSTLSSQSLTSNNLIEQGKCMTIGIGSGVGNPDDVDITFKMKKRVGS